MSRDAALYVATRVTIEAERLVDLRQSETALLVARGARRLLASLGFATATEVPLPGGRRADLMALGPDGELLVVEIKSSIADFRAEAKWPEYRACCDRLVFAIPDSVPADIMPEDAGLIVADGFGGAVVREPGWTPLVAARRKALTLAFARLAAFRG